MVSICSKKFAYTREKLLLSGIQAKKEAKDFESFLQKLKEKGEQSIQSNNVRVLSGTTIPNSTFKLRIKSDVNQTDIQPAIIEERDQQVICPKYSVKSSKDIIDEKSNISLQCKDKRSSILSGTGTLDELKELSDLLHKSSYIPKQKKTRRATIDKIKNAIEKEKHQKPPSTANKSQNTVQEVVTMVDNSTLTKKKIVKRKKKLQTDTKLKSKQSESIKGKQTTKQKVDLGIQTSFSINVRKRNKI